MAAVISFTVVLPEEPVIATVFGLIFSRNHLASCPSAKRVSFTTNCAIEAFVWRSTTAAIQPCSAALSK